MTVVSRKILKTFFQKGSKPTEEQFKTLIDSFVHVVEDNSRLGLLEFNKAIAYAKGATVLFNDVVYKANVSVMPGAFKEADWSRVGESSNGGGKKESASSESEPDASETSTLINSINKTLKFAEFTPSDNEASLGIATLRPASIILGVIVKLASSFSGAGLDSCILSVGLKSDKNKYLSEFDLTQKASSKSYEERQLFSLVSFDKRIELVATIKCEGETLGSLSSGEVQIYCLTVPMK